MAVANTLAYDTATITAAKSFIAQTPDNLFLKTFVACNGKKIITFDYRGRHWKYIKIYNEVNLH